MQISNEQLLYGIAAAAGGCAVWFAKQWMSDVKKTLGQKQDKEICAILNKDSHRHGDEGSAGEVIK